MDDDKPAQDARIRDSFWPDRRPPDHHSRPGATPMSTVIAEIEIERKRDRFERLTRWMGWVFVALAALLIGAHLVARWIQGAPT